MINRVIRILEKGLKGLRGSAVQRPGPLTGQGAGQQSVNVIFVMSFHDDEYLPLFGVG